MNEHLSSTFLGRVRRSYKLALSASTAGNSRIWGPIDERRSFVHAALMDDDDSALRNIFSDPVSSDLFLGADYLCRSVLGQLKNGSPDNLQSLAVLAGEPVERVDPDGIVDHFKKVTRRKLAALAKAARLNGTDQVEPTLRGVDKLLNQIVSFPNLSGEIGLDTSRGIATYRAVVSLYQAWLILNFLQRCSDKSVIEIGPGLGRTAYYAFRAGITDYSTVDLPMGIVAQACFLGAALGPDKICFYGEDDRAGCIRLYAAGNQPDRNYGLAFNSDSMTEMTMSAAMSYAQWIWRHCGAFFSINHDLNLFTVRDISEKWFMLKERAPYVMQGDYTEEYFVPKESPSLTAWDKIARHWMSIQTRRFFFRMARSKKKKHKANISARPLVTAKCGVSPATTEVTPDRRRWYKIWRRV